MATIIEAHQEGGTSIRVKTSASASLSFSGKLIGYGPKGLVSESGNMMTVFRADKTKVATFPKASWPDRKMEYYGDYFQ